MRITTQLAIKADINALPPRSWSRKDLQQYLAAQRQYWNAPKYLNTTIFIDFLVQNDIAKVVDIGSQAYGRKTRYVTGKLSVLQLACSFYKNSYLSHATALHVHGLLKAGDVFVNHEQTPKTTTSRLSQGNIDRAFQGKPRMSAFTFKASTTTITFLNGKNTGNAGVIQVTGNSGEELLTTSLERTLIDCVVRPQYAGGIALVAAVIPQIIGKVSAAEIARLLKQTKYTYPYHQALGFLLERAGMPTEALEPLRRFPMRFKFYLDYGMKSAAYAPNWKIFYPSELS